jgi:hypothetical protein
MFTPTLTWARAEGVAQKSAIARANTSAVILNIVVSLSVQISIATTHFQHNPEDE